MTKMFKRLLVLAASLAILAASGAEAQNYNLRPSYGSARLNAGFQPDPFVRGGMRAGGDRYQQAVGQGCPGGGWFANSPDFSLYYNAGRYALTFYVRAPGDTMLLINDPAANWYCNDDTDGVDPAIRFSNPRSGRYDIWLGTYPRFDSRGRRIPGPRVRNTTLYVTELR